EDDDGEANSTVLVEHRLRRRTKPALLAGLPLPCPKGPLRSSTGRERDSARQVSVTHGLAVLREKLESRFELLGGLVPTRVRGSGGVRVAQPPIMVVHSNSVAARRADRLERVLGPSELHPAAEPSHGQRDVSGDDPRHRELLRVEAAWGSVVEHELPEHPAAVTEGHESERADLLALDRRENRSGLGAGARILDAQRQGIGVVRPP